MILLELIRDLLLYTAEVVAVATFVAKILHTAVTL